MAAPHIPEASSYTVTSGADKNGIHTAAGQDPSTPASVNTQWTATCVRCHSAPPGSGGILCAPCRQAIETQNRAPRLRTPDAHEDDGEDGPGAAYGRALREAAHHYLDHGLLPVPAWSARQNGECCCSRGGDCPRPGKH